MSAQPRVVWKGSQQLTRKGRGRWKINAQDVTCTLRYEGPYDVCDSNMPLIGQTVVGYTDYGVKVADVELDDGEGSKGLLTVLLRNPYSLEIISSGSLGQQVGDAIPRLLWQPFRRKIESHPLCGQSAASTDGTASTDGHIAEADYQAVEGGWDYQDYQTLLQSGQTEYDDKQPVLTLETFWYTQPENIGDDNFTLQDPDANLLPLPPGTWRWLRGGDDLTRQDKLWRFVQTWTGFAPGADRNSAFELLYEANSGGGD